VDTKRASLNGKLEEYVQDYGERNTRAIEDLVLTGVVTSVEYK
jgi:hypothetical protein